MRPVVHCALLLALTAAAAAAGSLTIVLEFQGPYSERSAGEMKREFEAVMKDSGLIFDWKTRAEATGLAFEDLVLVRFKGKCMLGSVAYVYDERGPLASTFESEGDVQPFSEVDCDRVGVTVRSAMFRRDYARGDLLFGRALGRVVAHELIHVLAKSNAHGRDGVAKAAFSGKMLISSELWIDPEDLERIRTAQ
jgi:hypothetical protein